MGDGLGAVDATAGTSDGGRMPAIYLSHGARTVIDGFWFGLAKRSIELA